ncbi:MAG: hypothetical protein AB1726_14725, partial [Planctomycetota bacterium]
MGDLAEQTLRLADGCRRRGAFLGVLLAAACHERAASWRIIELPGDPAALAPAEGSWELAGGGTVRFRAEGETVWLEASLPRAAWSLQEWPGIWKAPRPVPAAVEEGLTEIELRAGETVLTRQVGLAGREQIADLRAGSYLATPDAIFMRTDANGEPGEDVLFRVRRRRWQRSDGCWRPEVGGYAGNGIPLWPGRDEVVSCDVPLRSVLAVATAVEPLLAPGMGGGGGGSGGEN